jgi:lysine 2,3-aminomutase
MKDLLQLPIEELRDILFAEDKRVEALFSEAHDPEDLRKSLSDYLNDLERGYFNIHSPAYPQDMHVIEKNIAKQCIRILKNILQSENEESVGYSALDLLYGLYRRQADSLQEVSRGFILEFLHLFRGMHGRSFLRDAPILAVDEINAETMGRILDGYALKMREAFKGFRKGCDPERIERQKKLKRKILAYFSADEADWQDYRWHYRHIIRDEQTLADLVALEEEEIRGIRKAVEYQIPFQITPHYLSLFNEEGRDSYDKILRAQVIPSEAYCECVHENTLKNIDMDFMGEKAGSPVPGITRRYPNIVILKPYDSCPQICVYCQRNWEIKDMRETRISAREIRRAIEWIRENESITEVLVTGGDPLMLKDHYFRDILKALSAVGHVERIRIGTRMPVTLPYRFTDDFIDLLRSFNRPGDQELCIVTHIEDALEITPEVLSVTGKLRKAGLSVYNQQVFTYYNSQRFKTAYLRKVLKLSGIDPYYLFNTKGKEETRDFRVPIARIEQERKEEARFQPGIMRSDEPVFNVPKLGKSNLRSWQNHDIIMILPNGKRVYRFYPWESMSLRVDDYLYTDVSICEYLQRLAGDGEDVEEYKSIWYYF